MIQLLFRTILSTLNAKPMRAITSFYRFQLRQTTSQAIYLVEGSNQQTSFVPNIVA